MADKTNFFTMHCPSCSGGIEFPTHGIGQQVDCPHCRARVMLIFPSTQGEDPVQQLEAFLRGAAFPAAERDLFALSLFTCPTEPSILAEPRIHYVSNASEATELVDRFVSEGLLQEASTDLVALLKCESSATLKSLAKERSLPSSGTKEILAKRLVKAAPAAMQARFIGKQFFACSAKGILLVEKWREAEAHKRKRAEHECVAFLEERRFKDAFSAMAGYDAQQLIPRGVGIDWQNRDASDDLQVLESIFTAQLLRHSRLNPNVMQRIRVAAAMIHLWGTNNPSHWLPNNVEQSSLDCALEARMLHFHALDKIRRRAMKEAGITRVEVLGSGASDECPACKADSGMTYSINRAPNLPHESCTCKLGCRCVVVAKQ